MNRRASCVGTFEVFEAAHVALRTLLAFSQPVNCIFWPIGMLNWLVAASKLHKHRETYNRPSSEHKIQTKLLLANPYANIEGQRIVVIPQQCKQRRTL